MATYTGVQFFRGHGVYISFSSCNLFGVDSITIGVISLLIYVALHERNMSRDGKVVWRFGLVVNALCAINIVAVRRARLVPGWVTVCGQVNNHLGI